MHRLHRLHRSHYYSDNLGWVAVASVALWPQLRGGSDATVVSVASVAHFGWVAVASRWFRCNGCMAKAFDTVNHTILLEKLTLYGLQGNALALIASYLSNRTQVVIIDGVKSEAMKITCGVPQGSILGPLLFILYNNDLPNTFLDACHT